MKRTSFCLGLNWWRLRAVQWLGRGWAWLARWSPAIFGLLGVSGAQGQFIEPDAQLRSSLQALADRGVIALSLSTWPLSEPAVQAALSRASPPESPALALLLTQARARVAALTADQAFALAQSHAQPLASFVDTEQPGSRLGVAGRRSAGLVSGQLKLAAGYDPGVWRWPEARDAGAKVWAEGSALSFDAWGAALSLGQLQRFWGPGWQGSLVLGNAAPAVAGLSLSRIAGGAPETPWLQWIGPWNALVFMGRLQGFSDPVHPWLVAMRVTAQPLPGLELGASRGIQWGGEGRDASLGSFGNAMISRGVHESPVAKDNSGQIAVIDARWSLARWGTPLALYAQAAAEESWHGWPSKWFGQAGAEINGTAALGAWRVSLEYANTAVDAWSGHSQFRVAYSNPDYREGYTNQRGLLGYPAGGDARLFSLMGLLERSDGSTWMVTGYAGTADRSGAKRPIASPQYLGSTRIGATRLGWNSPWQSIPGGVSWQASVRGGLLYQRLLVAGTREIDPTGTLALTLRFD